MELVSIWEVTLGGEGGDFPELQRGKLLWWPGPRSLWRGREGRAGGCGDSRFMDFDFFFPWGPLARSQLFWLQLLWGGAAFLPSAEWQLLPGFARCCSICQRQHFCLWGVGSLPPAPALKSLLLCIRVWRSPACFGNRACLGVPT